MIDTIFKVLAGVLFGAAAVGTVVVIHKIITKDDLKEKADQKMKEKGTFTQAMKMKVKEKEDDAVTVDILDEWDQPLDTMTVKGDGISDDIKEGDIIILKDEIVISGEWNQSLDTTAGRENGISDDEWTDEWD